MTTGTRGRHAAVIVTHDTRDEALACLATLADAGADEVVLVDAGSGDGTAATVRERFPEVHVVELPNVGFARAANAGVAASEADVVVIANADTRFAPGAISTLGDAIRADDTIGAAGPRVRYPDGRHQASARSSPSVPDAIGHAALGLVRPSNRFTRRYRMVDHDPDVARDADWLSGCAVAVRRRAFVEIEGFDPGFFMYVEDVDLGRRLREAGWRLRYEPSADVVHAVGASTGRAPATMVRHHARSLDRYYGMTYGTSRLGSVLRPAVRAGLAVWTAVSVLWGVTVGRRSGRSSTGE